MYFEYYPTFPLPREMWGEVTIDFDTQHSPRFSRGVRKSQYMNGIFYAWVRIWPLELGVAVYRGK